MNKTIFTIFFLILIIGQTYGQSNTVYKKLETKEYYSVNSSSTTVDGASKYEVNGKEVNKTSYEKYNSSWKNMENCCPCILKSYGENDILLREAVSCTDCGVGWFKEFYSDGKVSLTGHYKENPTGNWKNIWERGYCSVKNKQWTYYNTNGDTLYSEFWEEGKFIKQVPEQSISEIWDIEIVLNGKNVIAEEIPFDDIKNLIIVPKYKNSNTDSTLIIFFEVSAIGHKINEKMLSLNTFNNIDVNAILSEVGIPKDKKTTFVLSVFHKDQFIRRVYLNVKK